MKKWSSNLQTRQLKKAANKAAANKAAKEQRHKKEASNKAMRESLQRSRNAVLNKIKKLNNEERVAKKRTNNVAHRLGQLRKDKANNSLIQQKVEEYRKAMSNQKQKEQVIKNNKTRFAKMFTTYENKVALTKALQE